MAAPLIVLVNVDRKALQQTEALLSEAGYLVAAVASFDEATKLLDSVSPDLLVADVRLHGYSGLHLAVRSRVEHPDLPVIITHRVPDEIYQREARKAGAMFVAHPLTNPDFLRHVKTALERRSGAPNGIRRWPRRRAERRVAVRAAASAANIVDISYGGVRLAFADQRDVPGVFALTPAGSNVTVMVRRVWTAATPREGGVDCGAELTDPSAIEWRHFVDSVSGPASPPAPRE
jgi:DNA-binding response OmpR family regulator